MTKQSSRLLLILGGVAIGMTAPLFVAWLWFHQAGTVEIRVHERNGSDVSVCVPAAFVQAGLTFLPRADCGLNETLRNPRRREMVRSVLNEIARMPDADLVTVDTSDENVRISKVGKLLKIHVDDGEDEVRLSVPVGLVRQLARTI